MNPNTLGGIRCPDSEAPRRVPGLPAAIGRLADAASHAEERLAHLEGRLSPVMSPPAPETRNEAIRKDSTCEAAESVAFGAERVFELARRIDAVLDRLEV